MKKMYIYALVVVLIVAVVGILLLTSPSAPTRAVNVTKYDNVVVPQSVLSRLNISENLSNQIGAGNVSVIPQPKYGLNATVINGKPAVVYIGAEFCPYCAVTRWGMIIALMRFGTFSNLHYMTSSATDAAPSTPTFTFYNSTYTSKYITFIPVETTVNYGGPDYPTLQKPNQSELNLITQFNPGQSIPFIDFGNKSVQVGSLILPGILSNVAWNGTIENLSSPNTPIAQNIVGTADVYTAEICRMTNFTPANVCDQQYVKNMLGSA